jgi:hypothetical protein
VEIKKHEQVFVSLVELFLKSDRHVLFLKP